MKRFFAIALFISVAGNVAFAQTYPYQDDIATIKKYDQMYTPPAKPILFVGSSSIRKWTSLEQAFGSYRVINRGIGGAVTKDITYYADDIIFPYKPRQIVIYVGENDLPQANATPDSVLDRFKVLYLTIRSKMPDVPILYISIKPSPSRAKFQDKAKKSNELIKGYISTQSNIKFINVYDLMLDKNGRMRPEIFVNDKLHMNATGYSIWEKAVKPYLLN